MLDDYRRYLLNIRNNLIQCGVEFPITPVNDYRSLFRLEQELSDVLWYYHILGVSGSEDALSGFFLPLNGYYKDKMRSIFYLEFLDFIKDYHLMSVEYTLRKKSSKVSYLVGGDSDVKEDEFTEETSDTDNEYVSHGIMLDAKDEESDKQYVSHGVMLEDEEVPLDDKSYVEHGIFLEDMSEDKEGYAEHGIFLEDYEDSVQYDEDGFEVLDEESYVAEDTNDIQYDENGFEISSEESYVDESIQYDENEISSDSEGYVDDTQYDENGFEVAEEKSYIEDDSDDIEYDENGFEVSEEESYIEDDSDDSIEYDDDGFEISEEDSYIEDDSDDDIEYDEDGFEVAEEESYIEDDSDDGIEYDENGFEIDNSEDIQYEEDDFNVETSVKRVSSEGKNKGTAKPQKQDLSDVLQDFTNGLLTSGKRAILKGAKKFENK